MRSGLIKTAAGAACAAGIAAVAYPLFLRRPCLTWGATAEEASGKLPGDELLPDAALVSTRAVTIDAPPGAVWPWLVQMGSGRGGAYTYDWIENLLGLNMHSARRKMLLGIKQRAENLAREVRPYAGDLGPLIAGRSALTSQARRE
jgi:hypothetical protein